MFEVDQAEGKLRAIGAPGDIGVATIRVHFVHEDVIAELTVQLAAMDELVVSSSPYPEYPGSKSAICDSTAVQAVLDSANATSNSMNTISMGGGYGGKGGFRQFLDAPPSTKSNDKIENTGKQLCFHIL